MSLCEVDIVTGAVRYESVDVFLPTAVPMTLARRYVSSQSDRGVLGCGLVHNFMPSAALNDAEFVKRDPIAGNTTYPRSSCNGEAGPKLAIVDQNALRSEDGRARLRGAVRAGELLV